MHVFLKCFAHRVARKASWVCMAMTIPDSIGLFCAGTDSLFLQVPVSSCVGERTRRVVGVGEEGNVLGLERSAESAGIDHWLMIG
jgi:hypothetical protein